MQSRPILPVLYEHQRLAVEEVLQHIKSGETSILIVAPTGSGKTVIGTQLMAYVFRTGRPCLFVVPREPLIDQTISTAAKFGMRCGVIKSGRTEDRSAPIQIASVQTLCRRNPAEYPQADLVIFDEAHTSYSASWRTILKFYQGRGAIVVGLTATPDRTNPAEGLGEIYNCLVKVPPISEMIRKGILVPPVYYGPQVRLDLSSVKLKGKDFDPTQLNVVCNTEKACKEIVDEWEKLASDRLTICFSTSIGHSQSLVEGFAKRGHYAVAIDCETEEAERREIYTAFARGGAGDPQILVSVDVLEEGFDEPKVGCVIAGRPTWSRKKYVQQIGRGLRRFPGKKDCIIIDYAGNAYRFGFVTDQREFVLTKDKFSKVGDAPIKQCPPESGCGALLPISTLVCPWCQWQFPQKKKLSGYDLPLVELESACSAVEREEAVAFYQAVAVSAYRKEASPAQALAAYRQKFNCLPTIEITRGAVCGVNPADNQKKLYRAYLQRIAFKTGKHSDWVSEYMKLEFGNG